MSARQPQSPRQQQRTLAQQDRVYYSALASRQFDVSGQIAWIEIRLAQQRVRLKHGR